MSEVRFDSLLHYQENFPPLVQLTLSALERAGPLHSDITTMVDERQTKKSFASRVEDENCIKLHRKARHNRWEKYATTDDGSID